MLTEDSARNLASHWIRAWNAHDLDEIMSHYAEDVVLISPVAAGILRDPSGAMTGKDALRAYFKMGLDVYPNLKFDLIEVMWGGSSVILYYKNQKGGKTGEFMEIDLYGKVVRVVANYTD
jgi:ketosteroid isomerase-like protein